MPVPLNPSKTKKASSLELCEGSTFLWNGMMLEFFFGTYAGNERERSSVH